jgi:23S rRNA (guanosine2251-2'-O)-methyltransferase
MRRYKRGQHQHREEKEKGGRGKIYIYGRHALREALDNAPQTVRRVFLSQEAGTDRELRDLLARHNIPVDSIKSQEAGRMVGKETSHQGVIAVINPSLLVKDFDEFLRELQPTEDTLLILLDELTDPHNVGAVIRSAAAFGASGVLLPSRHQAPITGAVAKVSAGMVFSVPIVSIGNVNQTIRELKSAGFTVYGLAMDGKSDLSGQNFDSPSLFVVGNEGSGIRQKTLEYCDVTLRIPMNPRAESLNASVSAAVVMYEWSTGHKKALK